MPLDRTRFHKILALAESDQDGEALAAVRKAAAMARAAGLSLGQAVAGNAQPGADLAGLADLALQLTIAKSRAEAAEREMRALKRKAAQGDVARWQAGYEAGKEAGRRDAFAYAERAKAPLVDRIAVLEEELEAYRPPLDWKAIAKDFAAEGARWGSAKASAIHGRAKKGALTSADKVDLRTFSEKKFHTPANT